MSVAQSILGFLVLTALAWALSEDRRLHTRLTDRLGPGGTAP